MQSKLESLLLVILTVAAAVLAAGSLTRGRTDPKPPSVVNQPPTFVPEWQEIAANAVLDGPPTARVKILEFADLECPFCARINPALRRAQERHAGDVALFFVHFPLSQHRFARPSARAAECADQEARFGAFVDLVYSQQDSLGLKEWVSFARDAGIRNIDRFSKCVSDTSRIPRVEAGLSWGKRISLRGTPTLLVNGWRINGPVTDSSVSQLVAKALAGELRPVSPSR